MPDESPALADYRRLLRAHDWAYDWAEGNDWHRGHQERMCLETMRIHLDPDFAIWDSIAPEGYRSKKA